MSDYFNDIKIAKPESARLFLTRERGSDDHLLDDVPAPKTKGVKIEIPLFSKEEGDNNDFDFVEFDIF